MRNFDKFKHIFAFLAQIFLILQRTKH